MRQRIAGIFRSRIFRTLVLAGLFICLGGTAWGLKQSFDPGKVQAAHRHDEPINGYSSHADFEKECKHCHAPVRCLSANLCQDCHREIARERVEAEGLHGLLPGTDKCQTCHKEHQGRDGAVCDVPFGAINHQGLSGFGLDLHWTGFGGTPLTCESCHPDGKYGASSVSCVECHAADDPEQMETHIEQYGDSCARRLVGGHGLFLPFPSQSRHWHPLLPSPFSRKEPMASSWLHLETVSQFHLRLC